MSPRIPLSSFMNSTTASFVTEVWISAPARNGPAPRRDSSTENGVHHDDGEIVGICSIDTHLSDRYNRLWRVWPVDDVDSGLVERFRGRKVMILKRSRLPIAECFFKLSFQSRFIKISDHDENTVVRLVRRLVKLEDVVAG